MHAAEPEQRRPARTARRAPCRAASRRPWPRPSARPARAGRCASRGPGRRRPRAASSARPRCTPPRSRLVVDAAHRRLQHHREAELARGGERRGLALDDAAGIRGKPEVAQQGQRVVLVEARGRSASRARQRGERRLRERGGGARAARASEIAVIEQAPARRAGRTSARRAPGIPRGSRDDHPRIRARALAVGDEECRLAARPRWPARR